MTRLIRCNGDGYDRSAIVIPVHNITGERSAQKT